MTRQHIHLAKARQGAKSGPRANSSLFIHLSLDRLSRHDPAIPIYMSTNEVILTPGNEQGVIPSDLFERVVMVCKERLVPSQEEQAAAAAAAASSGTGGEESKRGKAKGGLVVWDEVVWEHGRPVEPPRQEKRVVMRF